MRTPFKYAKAYLRADFKYPKPDPEAEKAKRAAEKARSYFSDTEDGNVYILSNHTIWPHTDNREDIDRIYMKLGHIVLPRLLLPVGGEEGSATPLKYWYSPMLHEQCNRIRQELEPEEVSETRQTSEHVLSFDRSD